MNSQFSKNGTHNESDGNSIPKIVKYEEPYLTEEQCRNVKEVFALHDYDGQGRMKTMEVKVAMRALGFETKREEMKRMITNLNKKAGGISEYLSLNEFMELMAAKFAEKDVMIEIKKAFDLFDDDKTGFITLKNLKRVCDELGEKMREEDLQDMIDEADNDNDGAISLDEFITIMRKINLYG